RGGRRAWRRGEGGGGGAVGALRRLRGAGPGGRLQDPPRLDPAGSRSHGRGHGRGRSGGLRLHPPKKRRLPEKAARQAIAGGPDAWLLQSRGLGTGAKPDGEPRGRNRTTQKMDGRCSATRSIAMRESTPAAS